MTTTTLGGEILISLKEAAEDFGGVTVALPTVKKYVYKGVKGIKLETVFINGRYTSKEAIQRFIEKRQQPKPTRGRPKRIPAMSPAETQAILRRHGIIK